MSTGSADAGNGNRRCSVLRDRIRESRVLRASMELENCTIANIELIEMSNKAV